MDKIGPIGVEFTINNPEVKAASKKAEDDITGVADSAEAAEERVGKELKKLSKNTEQVGDILMSVSDEFRGLAEGGVEAFTRMTPVQQAQLVRLVDMQAELVSVKQAQKQLNVSLKEGKITAANHSRAMAALSLSEAELRTNIKSANAEIKAQAAAMDTTNKTMATQSTGVRRAKRQWDGLGNSINQLTREAPAFAVSMQTGILAVSNKIPILADEIANLKRRNTELINSGQKGVPVWRSVISSFLSWNTLLLGGGTLLTIYGKEVGKFFERLFKTRKAVDQLKASQEALNKALESNDYKKAVESIINLRSNVDLAKKGFLDKERVLKQYNDALGKSLGLARSLDDVETRLTEKAPAYIEASLLKAAAFAAQAEAALKIKEVQEEILEAERELELAEKRLKQKGRTPTTSTGVGTTITNQTKSQIRGQIASLKKEIVDLEKEFTNLNESSIEVVERLKQRAIELSNTVGIDVNVINDQQKRVNDTLKNKKRVLDMINRLDDEYKNSQLASDAQELANLRMKFNKIRRVIEEYNINEGAKNGYISINGLLDIQQKAEDELLTKQQKRVLKNRETLITRLQELDAAYADKQLTDDEQELKAVSDKFDKIRELVKAFNADPNNASAKIDLDQIDSLEEKSLGIVRDRQQERQKESLKKLADELDGLQDEEIKKEREKYEELLIILRDYNAQRQAIEDQYQKDKKTLESNLSGAELDEALAALQRLKNEELSIVDENAFQQSELYRKMNARILSMTRSQIKEHIQLLKNTLQSGSFTTADGAQVNLS